MLLQSAILPVAFNVEISREFIKRVFVQSDLINSASVIVPKGFDLIWVYLSVIKLQPDTLIYRDFPPNGICISQ